MNKLIIIGLLSLAACTNTTTPTDQGTPATNTHVGNDSGHPCSIGDTRRGVCY